VRSLANSKFITESSSERLLQIGEDLRVTAMSLVAYFFERSVFRLAALCGKIMGVSSITIMLVFCYSLSRER